MTSLNDLCKLYNVENIGKYENYEKEILDIFNNGNLDKYVNELHLSFWIANYYAKIKNYDKMKEYYYV